MVMPHLNKTWKDGEERKREGIRLKFLLCGLLLGGSNFLPGPHVLLGLAYYCSHVGLVLLFS